MSLSRAALIKGALAAAAGGAIVVAAPAAAQAQPLPTAGRYSGRRRYSRTSTTTTTASRTGAATTSTSSSSGTSTGGLTANARTLLADVQAKFPQITNIGGVRPDSLPDHPSGHALDFMMPNGTSDVALGNAVAEYVRANAARLNVSYIIWRQHIWSVARASQGWRAMANRGSATANHMDHVHVTVN